MGSKGLKDFKITGIVAAPFTPFHDNGELALDKIEPYIDHLLATGVTNVYICGTTGEGPSLTIEERKKVAEKWVKAANGRNDVQWNLDFTYPLRPEGFRAIVVQVGSGNLKEVQELAKHAESIGVDAISTIPTIFFKPSNTEMIAEFLRQVSNAAPTIPLYYYHNPNMTGINFSLENIIKLCSDVKTLRGAKFTSKNLYDLGRCIYTCSENYQFLYAVDEQLLPSLTLGIEGYIGSTYNYLGNIVTRLLKAYQQHEMTDALKEQNHINAVVNVLIKHGGGVAVNKAIANLSGLDLGPSRHPLPQLSEVDLKAIKADLENFGFFEFIK